MDAGFESLSWFIQWATRMPRIGACSGDKAVVRYSHGFIWKKFRVWNVVQGVPHGLPRQFFGSLPQFIRACLFPVIFNRFDTMAFPIVTISPF